MSTGRSGSRTDACSTGDLILCQNNACKCNPVQNEKQRQSGGWNSRTDDGWQWPGLVGGSTVRECLPLELPALLQALPDGGNCAADRVRQVWQPLPGSSEALAQPAPQQRGSNC